MSEAGHFALILALWVSFMQAAIGCSAMGSHENALGALRLIAKIQFGLLVFSFAALIHAFLVSDFSLALVAQHSHWAKPLLYKIAASWGNHEGSMLLFVLVLSGYGAVLSVMPSLPARLFRIIFGIQGGLGVLLAGFVLFTSNPFARLSPAPFFGEGLNPILQDPALAFHPPFLYLGTVGCSLAFSFAIAALWLGKPDREWARRLSPFLLFSWSALTLGVLLGSFWAYYELGWGGFWFWDPVENASLLPWLVMGALLHGLVMLERDGKYPYWCALLAIISFGVALLGTFIVRSGIITSIHAFAIDPKRGVFILAIFALCFGGACALLAFRMREGKREKSPKALTREGMLLLNSVFLSVAMGAVLLGTLYPLFIEALYGEKISVGAPYFNTILPLLMAPILFMLPIAPLMGWRSFTLRPLFSQLWGAGLLCLILGLVLLFWQGGGQIISIAIFILGGWIALGTLIGGRKKPSASLGMKLAHIGMGVFIMGAVATSAWKSEKIAALSIGESFSMGNYEITLLEAGEEQRQNYRALWARLIVYTPSDSFVIKPERRFYTASRSFTTEADIVLRLWGQLYAVLGESEKEGQYLIRIWAHPLAWFIWLGGFLIVVGGMVSIGRRR